MNNNNARTRDDASEIVMQQTLSGGMQLLSDIETIRNNPERFK